MAFTTLAAVATTASVASAVSNQRAAKAQRRSARIQERRMQLERSRARKNAIRQARAARGRALNIGANQGVVGSSGVQGALGSITSQANTNLSFLDQTGRLSDQAAVQMGKARKWQSRAQLYSDVGQIAMASMDLFGVSPPGGGGSPGGSGGSGGSAEIAKALAGGG